MKRHAFVQEQSLRPEIPFKDLIIFDGIVTYGQTNLLVNRLSSFQLTVYKRNDTILAIAHEDPANRGATIGEGASSIWTHVAQWVNQNVSYQENRNITQVQGHNGFYEYVKPKPPKPLGEDYQNGRVFIIAGLPSHSHDRYDWEPAGTLEEVLERHLA